MTSVERYGLILPGGAAEPAETRLAAASATDLAVASATDIDALVATYSTLLFRVAHALLRNAAEAEDTVQDAFVRVLAHRAKLPEVQDMRVWLVRITWRLALDRKRRTTPDQMDESFARSLVASHLPADQAVAEARELKLVLKAMDGLPNAEKHVLLLSAVEEMKAAEIAEVIGKSESAVRALLFRARTRLRKRLDGRSER
jgi:RNA polymerase sigma-70 factor (ECF subfamily)